MNFIDAIRSISEITQCLKNGLQALERKDKDSIKYNSSRDLKGSVYIDKCLERHFPNEPRWDYVIGYKDRVFYVEVHPADNTRKVREILGKLDWLKHSAKKLGELEDSSTFHWISTGSTNTSIKRGKYRQILAQNGIRGPVSILNVDTIT